MTTLAAHRLTPTARALGNRNGSLSSFLAVSG